MQKDIVDRPRIQAADEIEYVDERILKITSSDTLYSLDDSTMKFSHSQQPLPNFFISSYLFQQVEVPLYININGTNRSGTKAYYTIEVGNKHTKNIFYQIQRTYGECIRFFKQLEDMDSSPGHEKKKAFWGKLKNFEKLELPSKRSLCTLTQHGIENRRKCLSTFFNKVLDLAYPLPIGRRRMEVLLRLQEFLGWNQLIFTCTCPTTLEADEYLPIVSLFDKIYKNSEKEEDVLSFIQQFRKKCHVLKQKEWRKWETKQGLLYCLQKQIQRLKRAFYTSKEIQEYCKVKLNEDISHVSDHINHWIQYFVEIILYLPLEDYVDELTSTSKEIEFQVSCQALLSQSPSSFGISDQFCGLHAVDEMTKVLRQVERYSLPIDKIQALIDAAKTIFNKCRTCEPKNGILLSADDFLPVQIYVLIHAYLQAPVQLLFLMRFNCDSRKQDGEEGYYLTMFEAAIEYICNSKQIILKS